jgi:hypothetical protein
MSLLSLQQTTLVLPFASQTISHFLSLKAFGPEFAGMPCRCVPQQFIFLVCMSENS